MAHKTTFATGNERDTVHLRTSLNHHGVGSPRILSGGRSTLLESTSVLFPRKSLARSSPRKRTLERDLER